MTTLHLVMKNAPYDTLRDFIPVTQLTTQPRVVPPVHDRPFTDAEVPALLAYLRKL